MDFDIFFLEQKYLLIVQSIGNKDIAGINIVYKVHGQDHTQLRKLKLRTKKLKKILSLKRYYDFFLSFH